MNKTNSVFLGLLLCASLVACSGDHGHPHDAAGGHDDHGAAPAAGHDEHGHGHGGGISVTHYTPQAELFVEYPPLSKDNASAFAAHLTWLDDFSAVKEGSLVVTLSGGGLPEERVDAPVSPTPGIFRPVLTPRHAGRRHLQLTLIAGERKSVHDLGEVTVYPDAAAAAGALPPEEEEAGLIGFTKEQQWKIDFATVPAETRPLRDSVAVTATIRPRAAGEARLTAVSAGVLRPGPAGFPQLGQKVAAGQVLAYLVPRMGGDTDAAALALGVERARIALEQASLERRRLEVLLAGEAVPEKRVIEARQAERVAQAELQAARQRTEGYQGGSGGIPLTSPVAGTVVAVSGGAGAAVSEGQLVVHVAALDKLWLEARIPESELGRIDSPGGAWFRLDGAEAATVLEVGRNARLVAYGGMVDATSRTVPAILEFDNPQQRLRAGMTVSARLYTGQARKVVAVPASAIVDDNGQAVVFVLREGESFERRLVTPGVRDGEWVGIPQGIAAGERVVAKGAYQVRLAAAAPAAMGHGHAH
jgi:RND family efflux transporter MFP subunit